jgi:hypothetical protein
MASPPAAAEASKMEKGLIAASIGHNGRLKGRQSARLYVPSVSGERAILQKCINFHRCSPVCEKLLQKCKICTRNRLKRAPALANCCTFASMGGGRVEIGAKSCIFAALLLLSPCRLRT